MTAGQNYGYLQVAVTTAIEAIPIANATVTISYMNGGVSTIVKILQTDNSGKTEILQLDAPPPEYSLTPNPSGPSYSLYDIRVEKDGYYPSDNLNVPVFTGITSIQPVRLIPYVSGLIRPDYNSPDFPSGTVNESGAGINLNQGG